MSLLTFKEVKESDIPDIAGVCADSDQFRNYLNKATRMLMTRGNFYGTVQKIQVCTYDDCIVWPRYVGTVLAVNRCGHPLPLWNNWYTFVPLDREIDFCAGAFNRVGGDRWAGNAQVVDDGWSAVFNNVTCGGGNYIRAYPSTQQDLGKKTRIFGKDNNGQTILTQNADGSWNEGVELTLALPFVSTPFTVRTVERITKDKTQGPLRYYQYDANNNVLLDLVSYDPAETTPLYRRSKMLRQRINANNQACGGARRIDALIKLQFQPVFFDSDVVLIANQDALRDMIMSVKISDTGDKDGALKYELSGIHELNLEVSDKFPKQQTPVDINPFGTALPWRHGVGRIL